MGSTSRSTASPLRLVIQQPALPKYRVPVFAALAHRPGIALRLVHGASPHSPPNAPAQGFAAQVMPEREWGCCGQPFYWSEAQWRFASHKQADVLILSWNLRYLSLMPALLRARASGVKTILWGHGYSKHDATWRSLPRRKITSLATALLFYNHRVAEQYIAAGVDRKKAFVALNALDQSPIQTARATWLAAPDRLRAFQQEHDLARGPVVLFVSRLDAANRVDLLLEAAAKLKGDFPHLRIVIIGKGEPVESLLREQITRLQLANHVRLAGAVYDEESLAPYFLSAAAFCYPANIGLSMLHAFGYGVPVVTSDNPAAQNPEIEALRDAGNGLLYPQGDAAGLAAALRRLFEDAPLRARLATEAHRTATEQFTLANMVDGFEAAVNFCART